MYYDLVTASRAGTLTLLVSHAWQDDQFAGFTTARAPGVDIPSYGLTNLRLEWKGALGNRIDVVLFANNITDREYRIANNAQYESLGYALTQYGEPKAWGVSMRLGSY